MIFGPSGAGKTVLGRVTAEKLGFRFVDVDDHIWRWDTPQPFTKMVSRAEKIERLMAAIKDVEHFVMAGSMDSFHEHFDPFFELAVFLTTDVRLRRARVHEREVRRFGARVLEGGDMYGEHQRFLCDCDRYDAGGGSTSYAAHNAWAESMACGVLRLDGAAAVEENARAIVEAYRQLA